MTPSQIIALAEPHERELLANTQLKGTIKTRDGGAVVVIVRLAKIDDVWKIYGMSMDPAGAS